MMQEGFYKKLRVNRITEKVKGFKVFSFEEGHQIKYKAGQYLTFVRKVNDEEIRRSYSITSSPGLNEPLSVGIKRIANGLFSRYFIDHIQPGDEVILTGAGGFFVLPDNINAYRQVFFFAAGSGITPVFSLIKTALHFHSHLHLILVYSNSSADKTIFLNELMELSKQFRHRFRIEFLFSDTLELSRARLYSDLLIKLVKDYTTCSPDKVLFYICGPEAYMRMCTYVLQQEGYEAGQIRRENFLVRPKLIKALPPDKATREVKIILGGEKISVRVEYPNTILRSAKMQGISLPYSCEVGSCGNCAAKCIKGKIWHSYNEVLTEEELQTGLVLTCVAHPVGNDVEISFE